MVTLELGDLKALVIYGISQSFWLNEILQKKRYLKHSDGEVLALEVTTQATGEWIFSILESLSHTVGIPIQIIADHGPNLKKGIHLFQSQHPQSLRSNSKLIIQN